LHPALKTDQGQLVAKTYLEFSDGEDSGDECQTKRISLNNTVVVPRFDLSVVDSHFHFNNTIAMNGASIFVPSLRFAVDVIFNIVASTSAQESSINATFLDKHENKVFKNSISKYIVIYSYVKCKLDNFLPGR